MRKFLAVAKREYFKIVWTKSFILSTLLAPIFLIVVSAAPMMLMLMKGDAVRVALVDYSGTVANRLKENLSEEKQYEKYKDAVKDSFKNVGPDQEKKLKNSAQEIGGNFVFEDIPTSDGTAAQDIRANLNDRIVKGTLDAYLIIPQDYNDPNVKFEFFARNSGDFITNEVLKQSLEDAIRSERLVKANISDQQLKEINRKIEWSITKVSEKGSETDSSGGMAYFWISFSIAILIYVTLAIYGAAILQAVIDEKETRIAEILFSSARPFELMLGKLVGVGLAGLSQIAIWTTCGLILASYGVVMMSTAGMVLSLPNITPFFVIFFLLYFLIGFFIYATIYALIGSMVTSPQEGQQFAFPPLLLLMVGFLSSFAVIRDPNSVFAFWMSIAPFTAPIIMPVRILIETPPSWQIALSLALNILTILGLVWAAAKVYRIGMLMYGKRATVPEVWRWIWQR
jgi:ABC-2 type transport system permease protein